MASYLKILTNIFLTSISLSIILGSFLRIIGPINQSNQISRKLNITGKSSRSLKKELLINIYSNKYRGKFKQESLNKIMQININPYEFTLKKKHNFISLFTTHITF